MYKNNSLLYGLVFECPLINELDSCPFKNIRTKPIRERWYFINNMTEPEKEKILNYHEKCFDNRQSLFQNQINLKKVNGTFSTY